MDPRRLSVKTYRSPTGRRRSSRKNAELRSISQTGFAIDREGLLSDGCFAGCSRCSRLFVAEPLEQQQSDFPLGRRQSPSSELAVDGFPESAQRFLRRDWQFPGLWTVDSRARFSRRKSDSTRTSSGPAWL